MSSFCKCKSYSHFFSKNISIYAIFNDQNFNDTLTNNIVSFEQLGPACEKMVVITCGHRPSRSDCTFVQSDLGLHCSVPESLDTEENIDEHKRPHSDDTDA